MAVRGNYLKGMSSHLLLQIVFPDGTFYKFPAGGKIETELEEALAKKLIEKGVGFFRTEAHVEQDFHDAFKEVMLEFKRRVVNGH